MDKTITKLINEMTLEEKASLCSGRDYWATKSIDRLGIKSILFSDGTYGLRKPKCDSSVFIGIENVTSTCFPTGSALASSWDSHLLEEIGAALGKECREENIDILLGPIASIKRSPLSGRNFECFSEDPKLSGEMAAAYIKGLQGQGVGACLKHFIADNQMFMRMSKSSELDERTLREIYLANFEIPVKKAQPWAVMCGYNRLNGISCCEHKDVLTNIIRNEWHYEGLILSNWGAVNDRVKALKAGVDLEMPARESIPDNEIVQAVLDGTIQESMLDKTVKNILLTVLKNKSYKEKSYSLDLDKHHQLARKVATECIVLLKNEDNILPLNIHNLNRIAIIGTMAKSPRYQGSGDLYVNPNQLENAYDEIHNLAGNQVVIQYCDGYSSEDNETNLSLMNEAQIIAQNSDVAILFVGLPDTMELAALDRQHMKLPQNHMRLIDHITNVQPNTIVILSNGSPVEMPWKHKVKGIFEGWLTGQAGGGAIADLLFGVANPCAKLPETFPLKLSDNPSYLNFPGYGDTIEYNEGLFVGYRHYDAREMDVLFPFGYGLSYTKFEYMNINVSSNTITDTDILTIKVKIKNTGCYSGKEIVQLYVKDNSFNVQRPLKELKAFDKVELNPNEEEIITMTLDKRAFAYYDIDTKDWIVETGEFEILVGSSSRDIRLKEIVFVHSTSNNKKKFTRHSTIHDIISDPKSKKTIELLIPSFVSPADIEEFRQSGIINKTFQKTIHQTPLCKLIHYFKGYFTEEMLEQLLHVLNK